LSSSASNVFSAPKAFNASFLIYKNRPCGLKVLQSLFKKLSSFFRHKKKRPLGLLVAWQRPTLAECKSATIGAKELFWLEANARIFPHLHPSLTCLPARKRVARRLEFVSFKRFLCAKGF